MSASTPSAFRGGQVEEFMSSPLVLWGDPIPQPLPRGGGEGEIPYLPDSPPPQQSMRYPQVDLAPPIGGWGPHHPQPLLLPPGCGKAPQPRRRRRGIGPARHPLSLPRVGEFRGGQVAEFPNSAPIRWSGPIPQPLPRGTRGRGVPSLGVLAGGFAARQHPHFPDSPPPRGGGGARGGGNSPERELYSLYEQTCPPLKVGEKGDRGDSEGLPGDQASGCG